MAVTLAEAALLSTDDLQRGVIETFVQESPVLDRIPLLDIGQTAAGVDIIPQTETQGTATDASSLYFVNYGMDVSEGGVTGLTNGGIQVKDLGEIDAKPVFRTRIEFFCGLAVFGGKAASRLQGVLNA